MSTSPQKSVMLRERRRKLRSSVDTPSLGPRNAEKSSTLLAAREFSEPLALDMATAMMEASSNPAKAGGHFAQQEQREDAIGALPGREQRSVLRKNIQQDSDQQKYCELEKNDHAAGEKRAAAVALISRRQQALHDGLVGAMAGHGEKRAADQSRPEGVLGGEIERKIENLQFVSVHRRDLHDFIPAAGDAMQQHKKCAALPAR